MNFNINLACCYLCLLLFTSLLSSISLYHLLFLSILSFPEVLRAFVLGDLDYY